MRFLVTNDDGIASIFLGELVRALIAAGHEPFVVAPKHEQSWTGASKTRHRPVRSDRAEHELGCAAWTVDGTPSDCVNIGLDCLAPFAPDAVLSGINIGLNASLPFILGSGTVAGACEGALHGLPGIALSQSLPIPVYDALKCRGGVPDEVLTGTLLASAAHAARIGPALAEATPRDGFVVHNLNFPYPCLAGSEIRRTVPARVLLPGLFSQRAEDGTHTLVFRLGEDQSGGGPLSDRAALDEGYISHTILDFSKLGSI